jgi:hypothetical protein
MRSSRAGCYGVAGFLSLWGGDTARGASETSAPNQTNDGVVTSALGFTGKANDRS